MSTPDPKLAPMADVLNEEPPDILYHYTDQDGLLGIVSTGKMRATNIEYLNDQREYRHALALMVYLSRNLRQCVVFWSQR